MAKTPWRLLLSLGFTHFVADAISGFTVTSTALGHSFLNISLVILSYNIVAFAFQPLVGFVVDQWNSHRLAILGGMGLMGLGLLTLSMNPIVALAMIAIGSALIHVGAGALSSLATPTKSIGAALFTAPGVVGLTLGTLAAMQSMMVLPMLLVGTIVAIGALYFVDSIRGSHLPLPPSFERKGNALLIIALVLFVAFRSTLWLHESATAIPTLILAFGLAAGIGKLTGGFVADRFGRVSAVAVATAFALACFVEGSLIMIAIGIAALQSSTGIVLSAAVQRSPKYSATVAGLILGLGLALAGIATKLIG